MSSLLTLSTSGPAASFTLPKKRLRESSGEDVHNLDVSTQDKRNKQLKIEIPPVLPSHGSWSSCSTGPVKGSPSSLFSAASELNASFDFDQVSSIPRSQSATSHALDSWTSTCSIITTSIKGSPASLFSAESEVNSLFDPVPSIHHSQSATPHLFPSDSACSTSVPITDSPTSAMSEVGSLFDHVSSMPHALLTAPPIQGLYFDSSLCLPQQVAESVMDFCLGMYFRRPGVNQVMLFGRAPSLVADPSSDIHSPPNGAKGTMLEADMDKGARTDTSTSSSPTGLPTVLINLLSTLSVLLRPLLPEPTYTLLFPSTPTQARQAIINLYNPGEGISPHIDLLKRYGDGIIGVSLGSGCAMRFDRVRDVSSEEDQRPSHEEQQEGQRNRWDLFLPERSVLVLSEAARYGWTHGIDKRTRDYVLGAECQEGADSVCFDDARNTPMAGRWIERGVRVSVTFRWLLPGADVVGPQASN